MSTTVTARNAAGQTIALGTPVSLEFTASLLLPYRSLEVTVLNAASEQDLRELTLLLEGTAVFNGLVDRRLHTVSEEGVYDTFSCRSKGGAQMSDNEQAAYTYFQVTDTQMMETYAEPYGIAGSRFGSSASLNIFAVAEKETYWDLMRNYCLQAYGKHPYVDQGNYINLTPYTGRNRKISNTAEDGFRFSSLLDSHHRNAISKMYIKTDEDSFGDIYGLDYTNSSAVAAGIKRERYVSLSRSWEADAEIYANLQFFYSQVDSTEITAVLPGWKDLEPGDSVTLENGQVVKSNLYVGERIISAASQGITTSVKLWDKSYLKFL